ncbi:porin [Paraburkholderia phenoliruptrix]|uniref:porin n=1 Tax=Paraburkholderia phenoliruptrix TaxID=252970 RepID=UPI001C6EB26B|nr:porin [Paraburkholderia phenoliruptrix]MBW9107433.1 porin [Paraburkholderia phenoliruptrix]MBW9128145.1 porin [Paraburkholderia ginsengiterrae]
MSAVSFRTRIPCLAGALLGTVVMSAHAQSSVTLYGIVDAGLLFTSRSVDRSTGQNTGHQLQMISGGMTPSLFGLQGTEDLGGGMKTIFTVESGIDISSGGLTDSNGNFFGRQAWVGISSDYGTVKAGVQRSPFVDSLISTDARSVSYFGSAVPIYVGGLAATGVYTSNSISFSSPVIAGFQGSAMLALGGAAGDFQAGRQYSASINYMYGQLLITAAMYSGNAGGTAASTPIPSVVPFSGRTIGASYQYEKLTVKAVYFNLKIAGSFDKRVCSGGLRYQFTPFVDADAGVWYASDGNDKANHSILAAAGLTYNLSKATLLYSQAGYVNNHGKMNTGLSANGALYGVTGSTFGAAVGIRHIF